eukprot:2271694-Prorocentrum_lima.AAC.1
MKARKVFFVKTRQRLLDQSVLSSRGARAALCSVGGLAGGGGPQALRRAFHDPSRHLRDTWSLFGKLVADQKRRLALRDGLLGRGRRTTPCDP